MVESALGREGSGVARALKASDNERDPSSSSTNGVAWPERRDRVDVVFAGGTEGVRVRLAAVCDWVEPRGPQCTGSINIPASSTNPALILAGRLFAVESVGMNSGDEGTSGVEMELSVRRFLLACETSPGAGRAFKVDWS